MKLHQAKLKSEVDAWITAGVISRGQGDQILARYPAEARNYWLAALVVIGSVLCLGGVILIIASNWREIPALAKLIGLLALLIGSTVTGIESARGGAPRVASECGFLGAAVFPLLGLALISQIFHLDGQMSTLLLAWFAAIAPLPFLSRSLSSWVVWIIAGGWLLGALITENVSNPGFAWFCGAYIGFGIGLALVSQLWRPHPQRTVGEFIGVLTAGLAAYLMAFDVTHWFLLWCAVFAAALGLIYWGYRTARVHQVNFAFVLVALVLLSTFLRLVGTMAKTGTIFLAGGVFMILLAWGLNHLRRKVIRRIQ
ncbi:MAG TPA: DUF2157 domain-containing protein [Chthoniobacterales bacterium]